MDTQDLLIAYQKARRAVKKAESKACKWRENGLSRAQADVLWDQVKVLELIAYTTGVIYDQALQNQK